MLFASLAHPPQPVAVAVSGGADSMALALLAKGWARKHGVKMVALTVDHGLRKESATEAAQVKQWMNAWGVEHHTLLWAGKKPTSNVQAAARDARYSLLTDWCKRARMQILLVAHHREDVAETFLLRLARGSGVDGLSAMQPRTENHGIQIIRPLLDVPKARLVATLKKNGQAWIEDPGNISDDFTRARMRKLMPLLAKEGLTAERLSATAQHMARARAALELATQALLSECCVLQETQVKIHMLPFLAVPEELGLRALAGLIKKVGGKPYPPRFDDIKRLYAHFQSPHPKARTLGGCLFSPSLKKNETGLWRVKKQR